MFRKTPNQTLETLQMSGKRAAAVGGNRIRAARDQYERHVNAHETHMSSTGNGT